MKLCRLNKLIKIGDISIGISESGRKPACAADGNPFAGEPLVFSWESIRDGEVAMKIKIPHGVYLDSAVVCTGEKTALRYARISALGAVLDEKCAETGKALSDHSIELTAGVETDEIALLFCCDFSELSILSIDLYGSERERADIFPSPKSICFDGEAVPINRLGSYTVCPEAAPAGKVLADKLSDVGGGIEEKADGFVKFTYSKDVPSEGYRLRVSEDEILVTASDTRGFVMGAETLIKLIGDSEVPMVTVEDSPYMPFRGVHLMVPSKEQLTFAKRLIKYVISPLGYNTVILELAGLGMRFDSHPEIAERVEAAIEMSRRGEAPAFPHGTCVGGGRAVEKATLKEFVDYIRSFGIEVIPEVQSLGHVQFMTYTYPEIAEKDASETEDVDIRLADALPAKVYPHCYCPSNPRSYEILFDILDEVIELFAPLKYVHIGHDEVYQIGICHKCRETDPAELFASDVMRIYEYLSERGIKTMMWSDMLQPVTKYKTPRAAENLPRDIVMLDFIWYFHLDKDIEDNLLPYGYPLAFGNLYSSHFPRFESRIRKEGIIGGQISTWVSTDEDDIQKEGKFYDIYMVSEMLWSESYSHLHIPTYDRLIAELMPYTRARIKGIEYPSLEKGSEREALERSGADSFECREHSYRSLIFTHTLLSSYSRLPWRNQEAVGEYLLTYSDGETERLTIKSGREVGYFGARPWSPLRNKLYRHNGYTACYECDREERISEDGKRVTVYKYEHILPAGKTVTSVEWAGKPDAEKMRVIGVEGVV